MSTRSNIGIIRKDGKVEVVYCHFDGYPEGVGATLLQHYQDTEKIAELVDLGSLSILGPEIGEKHDFDTHCQNEETRDSVCLFYHRDRGEKWDHTKPETYRSLEYYSGVIVQRFDIEYCYIWDGEKWLWWENRENAKLKVLDLKAVAG